MQRGERLLPVVIDELAITSPNQLFAKVPLEPHADTTYRDVTIGDLANAINHASFWIEKQLGRGDSFATLSYAGPQDLRIFTFILASIKTGFKLFLLNTGFQSVDTYINLLDNYESSIFLTPAKRQPITDQVLAKRHMRVLTVPDLDDWFSPGVAKAPVYTYSKSYAEARLDPFVCVHTSGSTGPPKPVIINQGTVAVYDLFPELPRLGASVLNSAKVERSRMFFGMPLFHAAGIHYMAFCIYANAASVISPVWPMTPAVADAAHTSGAVDGSLLSPHVLTELSLNPAYMENIKRLKYLTFGGAPLPTAVGERLEDLTHLFVSFGATEIGYYALEHTKPEHWEYVSFSSYMGCERRDIGDGLYQFWIIRQEAYRLTQGIFATFPDLDSYTTKDVYSKHPSVEGLWLYEGRVDDLVVLSTARKFDPLKLEGALHTHPMVKGALVCGNNRSCLSALIETRDGADNAAVLNELWPQIEEMNVSTPYAQLARSHVVFTIPDRPMVRASKGSIIRHPTTLLYEDELDKVYAGA